MPTNRPNARRVSVSENLCAGPLVGITSHTGVARPASVTAQKLKLQQLHRVISRHGHHAPVWPSSATTPMLGINKRQTTLASFTPDYILFPLPGFAPSQRQLKHSVHLPYTRRETLPQSPPAPPTLRIKHKEHHEATVTAQATDGGAIAMIRQAALIATSVRMRTCKR